MSLSDAGQPTSHSWDGLSLVTGPVPIEHLVTALDMDAGKRWQHILMVDDFDGLPSRIVNEVLLPRAEAFMRADPVGCLRELATAARTLLELIQAAMAAEVVDSQDDSWAACAVRTG